MVLFSFFLCFHVALTATTAAANVGRVGVLPFRCLVRELGPCRSFMGLGLMGQGVGLGRVSITGIVPSSGYHRDIPW